MGLGLDPTSHGKGAARRAAPFSFGDRPHMGLGDNVRGRPFSVNGATVLGELR